MKSIGKVILFALVFNLVGCSEAETSSPKNEANSEQKETVHSEKALLDLDNGNPWPANSETTQGLNNMIEITNAFSDLDNLEAYQGLSDTLNAEFNLILKKCTMKGEAHNQLHSYLFPMKKKFKDLTAGNIDDSKSAFEGLKAHLSEYNTYFK